MKNIMTVWKVEEINTGISLEYIQVSKTDKYYKINGYFNTREEALEDFKERVSFKQHVYQFKLRRLNKIENNINNLLAVIKENEKYVSLW